MESSGKSIYRELPLFPSAPDNSVLNPQPQQQQRRQLTVFYNGRICVSDVTELRARAIIMAAMGEIEQMKKRSPVPAAAAAAVQSQICGPSVVSSMKRSLDRFLQKRKNRRMAPY